MGFEGDPHRITRVRNTKLSKIKCSTSTRSLGTKSFYAKSQFRWRGWIFCGVWSNRWRKPFNTYLLEKSFGWKGILCEPAQSFHQQLEENRTSIIDKRCVYSRSDSLIEFHEVKSRELSGIKDFHGIDGWKDEREDFISYPVKTVSLQDLLKSNGCPQVINYMSIDTEGSEFEIIKDFPFHEWNIECLSIEHNYTQNDFAIEELLAEKGFKRVCKSASRWDGWYIGRQI